MLAQMYKEGKFAELLKTCDDVIEAGNAGFEEYLYHALSLVGRNNFSRRTIPDAVKDYAKAAEIANEEQKKTLNMMFFADVKKGMEKAKEMFGAIDLTPEIVDSFREVLMDSVDAINAIAQTEDMKKVIVDAIEEILRVRKYDYDIGKKVIKRVDQASSQIREKYLPVFDKTVAELKEMDASYTAPEVPREEVQVTVDDPFKVPEGQKKTLVDKLLDFF